MRTSRARHRTRGKRRPASATVRRLALALPGVTEGTSYGTPAYRVEGKLFARLHQDGESLVVPVDYLERELLLQADPETFHITDHYRDYPWMLVRLSKVAPEKLQAILEQAWRRRAPEGLVAALARRP